MRPSLLGVAALCAPVVLAVPHGKFNQLRHSVSRDLHVPGGNHRHQHPARREIETDYSTVTDVVTVTANNAVVWVDQYKNVISTEYHGTAVPTTISSSSDDPSTVAVTSSVATAAPTSQIDSSSEDQETSAAPADSTGSPVSSIYTPSSDPSPTPMPLTTDTPDTTSPSPTTAESSVASAVDSGFQNKGVKGGNGGDAVGAGNAGNAGNAGSHAGNAAAGGGYGIDFELIGSSGCKAQGELNSEFGFLSAQGYSKIRFYDIGCDLSVATAAAAAAGMQVILGLNTIGNIVGDLATLAGMINGNWGPIDTVVIGNEVVNSGGDPNAVAAAVNQARGILQGAGFTKNVVAVDTYMAHKAHGQICQASSYCAVNAHAFFDSNTQPQDAGNFVLNAIASIASANPGKAVIVTESGWPYQGSPNGAAIPSPANQQTAIASLKNAFASNPGGLFLFQAYDATYKSPGPLGVEQFFGIYGH